SGSFGKSTSISIRGANPNQVQVLVDGMRVKSPTLGQVDLSDLSPELIERIEVIRGPQSTLYGADAIGGVVNIITRRGKGPVSAWTTQEAGNWDTLRSAAGVSGSKSVFDYSFGVSHFESNGRGKNDGLNQDSLATRLGLSLPGQTTLSLAVRLNQSDIGVPIKFVEDPAPIVPTIDPNARQESDTVIINLGAHTRPVTWWESEVRVGRYWNRLNFIDPPDPFACPPKTLGPPCNFPGLFKVDRHADPRRRRLGLPDADLQRSLLPRLLQPGAQAGRELLVGRGRRAEAVGQPHPPRRDRLQELVHEPDRVLRAAERVSLRDDRQHQPRAQRGTGVHRRGGPARQPRRRRELHVHGDTRLRGQHLAAARAASPLERPPGVGASEAAVALERGPHRHRAVGAPRRRLQQRSHA